VRAVRAVHSRYRIESDDESESASDSGSTGARASESRLPLPEVQPHHHRPLVAATKQACLQPKRRGGCRAQRLLAPLDTAEARNALMICWLPWHWRLRITMVPHGGTRKPALPCKGWVLPQLGLEVTRKPNPNTVICMVRSSSPGLCTPQMRRQ
jgi:hypothetical protein